MNTLKKSPTISLGPSEPPKDLNTVVPLGEQLQRAEEKKIEKLEKEQEKEMSASGTEGEAGGEAGGEDGGEVVDVKKEKK